MKYREFVYIPSEEVKEMICAILAKKGWRYNFHAPIPFYLYAPEMKGDDRLGWDITPFTDTVAGLHCQPETENLRGNR